jgi:hypothetical protein
MGDISLRGKGIVRVGLAKGGMTKSQETVKTAMSKFKKGKLHSGSKEGPVVKSRKQAMQLHFLKQVNLKWQKVVDQDYGQI